MAKRLSKHLPRVSDLPPELQMYLYDTGIREKGRNKWSPNMGTVFQGPITNTDGAQEAYVAVYQLVEVRKLTSVATVTTHEQAQKKI